MNSTVSRAQPLFVAYDLGQVEAAAAHAAGGGEVLTINLWVERALQRRGITVCSYTECRQPSMDEAPLMAVAQTVAREWYRTTAMRFFEYKGVPLGEAFEPALDTYLRQLVHYRLLFEQVLDTYPVAHLLVPYLVTAEIPSTIGPLAHLEMSVVVDAARAAAARRNLPFDTLGSPPQPPKRHTRPGSRWHAAVVALYNTAMGFLAPRRKIKIYVADYWRNIAPCMERMDDAELVLMSRSELRNIPWRQAWKHRVRLAHPHDAAKAPIHAVAAAAAGRFRTQWTAAHEALIAHLSAQASCTLAPVEWSLIEPALEYLVCACAERVIIEIEAFEKILRRERPSKVLLRVSVGQTNFFVLARTARRLGIPSIEIQHAGAHVDPRSVYSRLEADYLASYGPYVRRWYERIGVEGERILTVGSPRFDRCILERDSARERGRQLLERVGVDLSKPVLLVSVPGEGWSINDDSYALAEFFSTVRAAQERVPALQVVFKFRPGNLAPHSRDLVGELFGKRAVCMDKEDLFSLLCASTVAVCGNSTVIYEALLAQIPLLLHPWRRSDTYHAAMYGPAAPILYSAQELSDTVAKIFSDAVYCAELVAQEKMFLTGYSFDGKSSERMVSLLCGPLSSRS